MKEKFIILLKSVEFKPENPAGVDNLIAYMEES